MGKLAATTAGATIGVLIAALVLAFVRRLRLRESMASALLPDEDASTARGSAPSAAAPAAGVVQLTAEQALTALDGASSWPAIALRTRMLAYGGDAFAEHPTCPTSMCHAAGGRLAYARLSSSVGSVAAGVAVCAAAVRAEAHCRAGGVAAFCYLDAALIAPLRAAIAPVARLCEGNPMGMYALDSGAPLPAEPPPLPSGCRLRRLVDDDADQVNSDSGRGPNRMARAGIGCWGVEAGASLVGWVVRGADGAIGGLPCWRHRSRRGPAGVPAAQALAAPGKAHCCAAMPALPGP